MIIDICKYIVLALFLIAGSVDIVYLASLLIDSIMEG